MGWGKERKEKLFGGIQGEERMMKRRDKTSVSLTDPYSHFDLLSGKGQSFSQLSDWLYGDVGSSPSSATH